MTKIAIIGAGISGLALANLLKDTKAEITVFEKSRGVGGRMSTRRAEEFNFDHGAQCFTIRTKEFESFLKPFLESGLIQEWHGNVVSIENGKIIEPRIWNEKHYVASPSMNSLCKKLAENLNVKIDTEILPISKKDNKWSIQSKQSNDFSLFDIVVSTAPPMQTINLFKENFCYTENLKQIEMHPCFALMLGFKDEIRSNWMAARIRNSKIKWTSFNNSKPNRNKGATSIVVHASNTWSNNNVNIEIAEVQKQLFEEFEMQTGIKNIPDYRSTHRWLYSIVKTASKPEYLLDESAKLSVCGDSCLTSRIEDAFLSSQKLADKLKTII